MNQSNCDNVESVENLVYSEVDLYIALIFKNYEVE